MRRVESNTLNPAATHSITASHSIQQQRVRRPSTAHHATQQYLQRQIDICGHGWWLSKLAETVGRNGGGCAESKLLQPPLFESSIASPRRSVSTSQYLRQPSDDSINESWQAAADNLGAYSNRMPIDPLRDSRRNGTPLSARPSMPARSPSGSARGGLDFNFARTPSAAAQVVQGAKVVEGRRGRTTKRSSSTPKYAQYYQVANIPKHSRMSISEVGARNTESTSPSVRGPTSPIYIEKNRMAEWTSDSTLHPLILSKRLKGWAATPIEAVPKNSPTLTQAGRESNKARFRHLISNEARPQIKSFFLDGLDAQSEPSRSHSRTPSSPQPSSSFKAPDPQSAGNGLVRAHDDRCKPGAKVKVAFSFCMEPWARDFEGQVGVLVDRSPFVSGSWRVRFPSKRDLVECSVGLMGRYHLVYAEEDAFEDAGEGSKIVARSPSKRSLASSPSSSLR